MAGRHGPEWAADIGRNTHYGENYALRAEVAATGLGGIVKEDAVYANCSTSIDPTGAPGAPLTGSKNYTIHFPAGQLPPVYGFWSITVYNQNILLVKNAINRYNVGSETGLVKNGDESLTIYLQSDDKPLPPNVPQANWLPVPRGAPFSLTLRMYWPQEPILNGRYQIPAVVSAA
jgi:hypothetical protein